MDGANNGDFQVGCASTLWARSTKNPDKSIGPLARPFAHSLALLTCSLAPHYSLHLRALLRSLIRSFAHFTHSLAHGKVNDLMAIYSVFSSILAHSALATPAPNASGLIDNRETMKYTLPLPLPPFSPQLLHRQNFMA